MEIRKEEEYFLFFYHSFPIFYCCSYDLFMLELITRALSNRKKRADVPFIFKYQKPA